MKKIIFTLLLLFVGTIRCQAETYDSFSSTFLPFYHYVDNQTGAFGDFEMFRRNSDGAIAFCIEPGKPLSNNNYLGYENLSMTELANRVGLTKEKLEEISYIVYFGYDQDFSNTQWIVATQALIWETLGRDFSFTSYNSAANPWAYVVSVPSEIAIIMERIKNDVANFKNEPTLLEQNISLIKGETWTFTDNALANYELVNNEDTEELNNNTLVIQAKKAGKHKVTLKQKFTKFQHPFIVYHHDNGQDLFLAGNIIPKEISFTYEVQEGSVKILKLDAETKSCNNSNYSSLDGAVFGLFSKNGTKLKEITVKNCEASISGLGLGEYYLQEIKAPHGYQLNEQKYYFTVTKENIPNEQKIVIYNQKKKIELQINKKYLQENKIELNEEGVAFEILEKNTLKKVTTLITDKNGNASISLPYGEYILKQIKGKNGYQFIDDYHFKIDDKSDSKININFVNKPILKKIKIVKKDNVTKETIQLKGFTFQLYDLENKKKICHNPDCTFQTDEFGEVTIPDLYYSTYQIKEVKKAYPGYLWNSETINITINDNSELVSFVSFYNQPVKGQIILNKTDEENMPMVDIEFLVFAKENIYENNVLCYRKDELVASLKTDKDGKAEILLPLGTYFIHETKSKDGYKVDENRYDVSLQYIDEETPIVQQKFDFINYKIPSTYKEKETFWPILTLLGAIGLYVKKSRYFL